MPYITADERYKLDVSVNPVPVNAGQLNYLITRLLLRYVSQHGDSYAVYNDVIGAVDCAKHEFYRRKVVSYEDDKAKTNGDVY